MICPFCKEEIKDDAIRCRYCGSDLPQKDGTLCLPATILSKVSRYNNLKEVGKGGMGIVYRVYDTVLKETVALKELPVNLADDKKAFERFIEEARSTRRLTHPNIVRIYDIVEEGGRNYISMEYIDGKDLGVIIKEKGRFSVEEVIQIASQFCKGLEYAHTQGVIHRDLKPSNILLTGKGGVKIADFGIAKALDRTGFTTSGQILGTPEYMSPEQAEGKDIDYRTDIYSLGIVLYEMLTGKVPLTADSTPAVLYKQVHENPKPLREHIPEIPSDFEKIVLKCLEKDKSRRYQNVHELSKEISLFHDIMKEGPAEEVSRRKVVPRLPAIAIGVILVVAGGLGSWAYYRHKQEKAKTPQKQLQRQDKLNLIPQEITNSVGMKLVLIKAGTFMMGSPSNEKDRNNDELQHRATLTKDFYLQTTEVTQAQYEEIMGGNPSKFKGRNLPVEEVPWYEAVKFCKRLSEKEGKEYRLPTEAEWEYACRAGSQTRYAYGNDAGMLEEYAWYHENSDGKTHPVGSKRPNTWGLYDMPGNVWEWCSDKYTEYRNTEVTDPTGPENGGIEVLRGGSWLSGYGNLRSASRNRSGPNYWGYNGGFRCARTP